MGKLTLWWPFFLAWLLIKCPEIDPTRDLSLNKFSDRPNPHVNFTAYLLWNVGQKKICNVRQLNEANYMSYSFQKTYQIIIFRRNVSLTEPLQLQGHWWHYEMDTLKFYESNLVWIGEEVLGVLCKSLGGGVPLGYWNPNPQYLEMVNLIHS